MDTYTLLREIADSWVLLAMFLFFIAVAVWAFMPGQRQAREEARLIPFRNEAAAAGAKSPACSGTCETCACASNVNQLKDLKNG